MHLALATLADVPRLTRCVNAAYRGQSSRQGWTTEADLLDGPRIDEAGLREMLAQPGSAMLLGQTEAGELLGSLHVQVRGEVLYLAMLAVQPAGQARGVGRFLLQAAEAHGRRQGCAIGRMTVIAARAELLAYYARRGYHPTGATEPFPTDPRFGIPKQPLELLVLEKPL